MVGVSNKPAVVAQAYINISFLAANVNTRLLKFAILFCSPDFYIMEVQEKVMSQFFPKAVTQK